MTHAEAHSLQRDKMIQSTKEIDTGSIESKIPTEIEIRSIPLSSLCFWVYTATSNDFNRVSKTRNK